MTKKLKAFTLVELLVVVAIIGILSTIVAVNYVKSQEKARDAKRIVDVKSIQSSVEMYFQANGVLPGIRGYWYQSNHTPWWSGDAGNTGFADQVQPYLNPLPRDPKKGEIPLNIQWTELVYRYRWDNVSGKSVYEVDGALETDTSGENDGGNRNGTTGIIVGCSRYEVGTNLYILN